MKKKICLYLSIVMVICVALMGCGKIKNYDKALITADKEEVVTLGYANFAFKYDQALYDFKYVPRYGATMWTEDMTGTGSTMEQQIKDSVIETLEEQYVMRKHATDFGISLSEDEIKAIEEAADKFIEANTSSGLSALGADRDTAIQLLTNMTYVSKVEKAIIAEGKANGQITDSQGESNYVNTIVSGWKNQVKFEVDDALWNEVKVSDLFEEREAASTTSTTK